tara:strand:- start:177 stop:383 length:207 start_codon:yes stop_codon:yes gene_type:complete
MGSAMKRLVSFVLNSKNRDAVRELTLEERKRFTFLAFRYANTTVSSLKSAAEVLLCKFSFPLPVLWGG